MRRPRLRASVLTAGRGTRLRPLSLVIPKPLLPIGGEPVVGHTLRQLAALGCEAAVLNLHHLPEAIPAALGRAWWGLPILYSPEEEIQGTLGALHPQRDFLAAADLVLLVNGDTLCCWPWRALLRRHLRSGADATLILHRREPEAALGGGVGIDARGAVVQLRDADPVGEVARRHVFAGAHVLSPKLLDRVEEGPADIIDGLYLPLLAEGGRIASVVTARHFHDLGTADRYLEASLDWGARGPWPWLQRPRNRISPLARISGEASVHRSVVEAGVVIEGDARVEGSVLLAGVEVAAGSRIRSSILGPGVKLAEADIEHRMVNVSNIGYEPGPEESVMGDYIYTPI